MVAYGNQNQLQPLLLLLEIFSKPSCSFQTWTILTLPPHHRIKGSLNEKGYSKVWKKKCSKWFCHFFSLPFLFLFVLLVCFALLFYVNLVLCIALFNLFLFVFFSVLLYFVFSYKIKKKIEKKKYKNRVWLCTLILVYLGWPLKQNFLNFVSFVA